MKEYKLVIKNYSGDLVQAVNEFIRAGWTPLGSPQTMFRPAASDVYIQAMVKE